MKHTNRVGATTEMYKNILPEIIEKTVYSGRETVQTVVWVVGLSGTLLVFIVANPTFLTGLPQYLRILICVLLGGTMGLGVIQRMVYRTAEDRFHNLMYGLNGYLIGRTTDFNVPLPLDEKWDRVTIIKLFRDFFDLDAQFLEDYDVPLHECQEHYKQIYQPQADLMRTDEVELARVIAAYGNIPEKQILNTLKLEKGDDYADGVRQGSKPVYRWQQFSIGLFHATCVSFMLSVMILTIAAITKVR